MHLSTIVVRFWCLFAMVYTYFLIYGCSSNDIWCGSNDASILWYSQVVGTLIMAALVLVVNLFGLQRIVDIIGLLGPITIAFTIIISIVA